MKQDVLYIRDAVSKTITVTPEMMTIISEHGDDELVIPNEYLPQVERMFEFAYNRADEFSESDNGVMLEISGGAYPEQIGDPAHDIYVKVTK